MRAVHLLRHESCLPGFRGAPRFARPPRLAGPEVDPEPVGSSSLPETMPFSVRGLLPGPRPQGSRGSVRQPSRVPPPVWRRRFPGGPPPEVAPGWPCFVEAPETVPVSPRQPGSRVVREESAVHWSDEVRIYSSSLTGDATTRRIPRKAASWETNSLP